MKMNTVLAISFTFVAGFAHADKKVMDKQLFKLDTTKSTVTWTGFKKVGSPHTGNISISEGQLEMKKGEIAGGMFKVDMASLTDNDLKDNAEYQQKLVGHLKSPDFFDVTKKGNESSTFKILKVQKKSATEVLVTGELTMIGATHPIEFPATLKIEKDMITSQAKVKIDRTKWGLKYGSGDFFKELAADKIISNEFELDLNLTAKK